MRFVGGIAEGVIVAHALHLFVGGAGDTLPAIADIDAPQACRAVDETLALVVGQPHAAAVLQDHRRLGEIIGDGGHRMHQAQLIHFFQSQIAQLFVHSFKPYFTGRAASGGAPHHITRSLAYCLYRRLLARKMLICHHLDAWQGRLDAVVPTRLSQRAGQSQDSDYL